MKIQKPNEKENAITLIALVVTIVILLILAGIAISQITGENGIFNIAKRARNNTLEAQEAENITLADYENTIDQYVSNVRENIGAFEVIYDNQDGAATGELSQSINDFDLLIAIYGSAIDPDATNSQIFTPKDTAKIEVNFATAGSSLYGVISFTNKTFSANILYDTGGVWTPRYVIYKVIGIKV